MTSRQRYFLTSTLLATTMFALSGCDSDTTTVNEPSASLPIGAAVGNDFVAIRVEAENYNDLTGGWTLTSHNNIPTITPDPDPVHFSSASGGAYVELLPDTRTNHSDDLIGGENFWSNPGGGPRLEYNVNIPESGRYFVYVKAYSTGPEDNGIHVGINGTTPQSGHRVQLCSGKHNWTWSSAQRTTENHCGVTKTIFLDVESAGNHTVTFYAREDGFELDQFILLKDVNPETRDCFPLENDKIRCRDVASRKTVGEFNLPVTATNNGNFVAPPPPPPPTLVDLQLNLTANTNSAMVSEQINYTVSVENTDDTDTATDVTARVTLPVGMNFVSSDICTSSGRQLTCDFADLQADEQVSASFTVSVDTIGSLQIDAQVSADENDPQQNNNVDSEQLAVSERIPDYDGALSLHEGPNALGLSGSTTHLLVVSNEGLQEITSASLNISSDPLFSISTSQPGCSVQTDLTCDLSTIQPNESISIPLTVHGALSGQGGIIAQLNVPSDEDVDNNRLSTTALVIDDNIVTDLFGVLTIEAESFTNQSTPNSTPVENDYNPAWFVVSDTIMPSISPDFDSANASTSSNNSYVEYLPDTRLGDSDPVLLNISNYNNGGESATLSYNVFIKEPGRYFTSALVRANNAQDATIHIGLNDQWPSTSANLTVCTPDGTWQWSNSPQCSVATAAYIDIASPGIYSLLVSAATDGVELDKITLSLEDSSLPDDNEVDSKFYVVPDIDLRIANRLSSDTYTVSVVNPDPSEIAIDVLVQLEGIDVSQAAQISGFDGCTAFDELQINCKINFVPADSQRTASLELNEEATTISATLISASDSNSENNFVTANGGGSFSILWLVALLSFGYLRPATRRF